MRVTQRVKKILSFYDGDNPGTKSALAQVMMEGKLAGTGRLMIMPVKRQGETTSVSDQKVFDPYYHFQLAVDGGLSALSGSLDVLEAGADHFAGSVPLVLKMNSAKTEVGITASIGDALRLGCVGIGCLANPEMEETSSRHYEIQALAKEARAAGLVVILRAITNKGTSLTAEHALAAAKTAALIGAHIVCVDVPGNDFKPAEGKPSPVLATQSDRIRYIRQSCFTNRTMVLFVGSDPETDDEIYADLRAIRDGAGHGYVLPQTSLHRSYDPALQMLDQAFRIYQGKA